jgi:hypothetical protein
MTVLTPAGGYIDEDPLGDARSRHRMVEGRQKAAARDRVTERVAARSYNERGLAEPCSLAEVNPPEQIARRLARAIRYIPGDQLPDRTPTEGLIAEAVRRNPVETAPATPPEQLLEATIKTPGLRRGPPPGCRRGPRDRAHPGQGPQRPASRLRHRIDDLPVLMLTSRADRPRPGRLYRGRSVGAAQNDRTAKTNRSTRPHPVVKREGTIMNTKVLCPDDGGRLVLVDIGWPASEERLAEPADWISEPAPTTTGDVRSK